jgi:hypothetical protein
MLHADASSVPVLCSRSSFNCLISFLLLDTWTVRVCEIQSNAAVAIIDRILSLAKRQKRTEGRVEIDAMLEL